MGSKFMWITIHVFLLWKIALSTSENNGSNEEEVQLITSTDIDWNTNHNVQRSNNVLHIAKDKNTESSTSFDDQIGNLSLPPSESSNIVLQYGDRISQTINHKPDSVISSRDGKSVPSEIASGTKKIVRRKNVRRKSHQKTNMTSPIDISYNEQNTNINEERKFENNQPLKHDQIPLNVHKEISDNSHSSSSHTVWSQKPLFPLPPLKKKVNITDSYPKDTENNYERNENTKNVQPLNAVFPKEIEGVPQVLNQNKYNEQEQQNIYEYRRNQPLKSTNFTTQPMEENSVPSSRQLTNTFATGSGYQPNIIQKEIIMPATYEQPQFLNELPSPPPLIKTSVSITQSKPQSSSIQKEDIIYKPYEPSKISVDVPITPPLIKTSVTGSIYQPNTIENNVSISASYDQPEISINLPPLIKATAIESNKQTNSIEKEISISASYEKPQLSTSVPSSPQLINAPFTESIYQPSPVEKEVSISTSYEQPQTVFELPSPPPLIKTPVQLTGSISQSSTEDKKVSISASYEQPQIYLNVSSPSQPTNAASTEPIYQPSPIEKEGSISTTYEQRQPFIDVSSPSQIINTSATELIYQPSPVEKEVSISTSYEQPQLYIDTSSSPQLINAPIIEPIYQPSPVEKEVSISASYEQPQSFIVSSPSLIEFPVSVTESLPQLSPIEKEVSISASYEQPQLSISVPTPPKLINTSSTGSIYQPNPVEKEVLTYTSYEQPQLVFELPSPPPLIKTPVQITGSISQSSTEDKKVSISASNKQPQIYNNLSSPPQLINAPVTESIYQPSPVEKEFSISTSYEQPQTFFELPSPPLLIKTPVQITGSISQSSTEDKKVSILASNKQPQIYNNLSSPPQLVNAPVTGSIYQQNTLEKEDTISNSDEQPQIAIKLSSPSPLIKPVVIESIPQLSPDEEEMSIPLTDKPVFTPKPQTIPTNVEIPSLPEFNKTSAVASKPQKILFEKHVTVYLPFKQSQTPIINYTIPSEILKSHNNTYQQQLPSYISPPIQSVSVSNSAFNQKDSTTKQQSSNVEETVKPLSPQNPVKTIVLESSPNISIKKIPHKEIPIILHQPQDIFEKFPPLKLSVQKQVPVTETYVSKPVNPLPEYYLPEKSVNVSNYKIPNSPLPTKLSYVPQKEKPVQPSLILPPPQDIFQKFPPLKLSVQQQIPVSQIYVTKPVKPLPEYYLPMKTLNVSSDETHKIPSKLSYIPHEGKPIQPLLVLPPPQDIFQKFPPLKLSVQKQVPVTETYVSKPVNPLPEYYLPEKTVNVSSDEIPNRPIPSKLSYIPHQEKPIQPSLIKPPPKIPIILHQPQDIFQKFPPLKLSVQQQIPVSQIYVTKPVKPLPEYYLPTKTVNVSSDEIHKIPSKLSYIPHEGKPIQPPPQDNFQKFPPLKLPIQQQIPVPQIYVTKLVNPLPEYYFPPKIVNVSSDEIHKIPSNLSYLPHEGKPIQPSFSLPPPQDIFQKFSPLKLSVQKQVSVPESYVTKPINPLPIYEYHIPEKTVNVSSTESPKIPSKLSYIPYKEKVVQPLFTLPPPQDIFQKLSSLKHSVKEKIPVSEKYVPKPNNQEKLVQPLFSLPPPHDIFQKFSPLKISVQKQIPVPETYVLKPNNQEKLVQTLFPLPSLPLPQDIFQKFSPLKLSIQKQVPVSETYVPKPINPSSDFYLPKKH